MFALAFELQADAQEKGPRQPVGDSCPRGLWHLGTSKKDQDISEKKAHSYLLERQADLGDGNRKICVCASTGLQP